MKRHHKINYIETPVKDIEATKTFFSNVFGWEFIDFGSDYCSFVDEGIDGGFYRSNNSALTKNGSVLLGIYSENLEQTQDDIEKAGGKIIKPVFSFPGGRRFHFSDPNGNEFAVWSE